MRTRFGGSKGTLRAVQFTDVHLGENFSLLQLQKLVDAIMAQKPEVIFFTGDLINAPKTYRAEKQAASILAKLQAPYGKIAVLGNHDFRKDQGEKSRALLQQAGFTVLNDSETSFTTNTGWRVRVVGMADSIFQRPDYSIIKGREEETLCIVLAHETDFAEEIADYVPDVVLAGHTHGGQIRLGFLGTPVRAIHAKKFPRGIFTLGRTTLYVDSGVGLSGIPARFDVVPQFTVLKII